MINLELFSGFDMNTSPVVGYSESRRPFDTTNGTNFHHELNNLLSTTGHFQISINGSQFISIDLSSLIITHASGGNFRNEAGEAIKNEINTQLNSVISSAMIDCEWQLVNGHYYVLRISSDFDKKTNVRIIRAASDDLAGPMMLGLDQGGIEVARYSNFSLSPMLLCILRV